MQHNTIVIIGGGLSGLTLAFRLQQKGHSAMLLESSPRFGGRIQTQKGVLETPLELGATWFSDAHEHLLDLLQDLELDYYPQFTEGTSLFQTKAMEPPQKFHVPASEAPSYRLKGGTETLIQALASKLPSEVLKLNSRVTAINDHGTYLEVETGNGEHYVCDKVVLCLPPQLVGSAIKFSPKLPDAVSKLLPEVQTWMAGSIKFTMEYQQPFWKQKSYSGMLFSHVGIVTEMYDHSNFEQTKFGFTGFLHGSAANYTQEERRTYVLQQLSQLLGPEAANPVAYFDKVWTDDYVLGDNELIPRPHFNNGHPLLQSPYFDDKLFFAGTETDARFSGYMEGAVRSALRVSKAL